MDSTLTKSLSDLKETLLALRPTGAEGFEGLIALVLGKVTGYPFRLAGGGSQHGKDGEAITDHGHMIFEAKRYASPIKKNEVLSKLTEIIAGSEIPDIWVLAATTQIKTQITGPLRVAAERNSIAILFLDWPPAISIPPLAAACAAAGEELHQFLRNSVTNTAKVNNAIAALKAIRAHNAYAEAVKITFDPVNDPNLGAPTALKANREFLTTAFSNRQRAKQLFGQALAPLDQAPLPLTDRKKLRREAERYIFGKPDGHIVVMTGSEGAGKSWLFAQCWLAETTRPFTIVISATDLKDTLRFDDIESFLINKIIRQVDGNGSDFNIGRWRRRFRIWRAHQNRQAPNVIVFIDGLNQEPRFQWVRWLEGVNVVLEELGGVLVVSVRQLYFHSRLKDGLISPTHIINVPEWSMEELAEILTAQGTDFTQVHAHVATSLRNPRILAIAFELLDSTQIRQIDELTVERLLFEHIRVAARDGGAAELPELFIRRLADHAKTIVSRVKENRYEDKFVFETAEESNKRRYELSADLLAVSEGRFFQPLPEDSTLYSLSEEGLVVALALSVIKALQKAVRSRHKPADRLGEILDPIAALDKTGEVILAATVIATIDERCSVGIRAALMSAYLRLQNIDHGASSAFASLVRDSPEAAMAALFDLATSSLHAANKDWLISALRSLRSESACWNVMSLHFHGWLRLYSLNPDLFPRMLHTRGDGNSFARATAEREEVLEQRLHDLHPAENSLLSERMQRQDDFDPAQIWADVFSLLAGMPLSDFCESFVAWSFSQALNSSLRTPHDHFRFLIQFNSRDWRATREGLLTQSSFLRRPRISRVGRWALVEILQATGACEDSEQAAAFLQKLRPDREERKGWRLVEKYCKTDPCDPTSCKPSNIATTVEKLRELDFTKFCRSRGITSDEHFMRDALPGLVRFESKAAISAQIELGGELVLRGRSEFLLSMFSLESNIALLQPEAVSGLLAMASESSASDPTSAERSKDEWTISQYALLFALPHLGGGDQLNALMSVPPRGPPLLKLIEVMRPAAPGKLEAALRWALESCHSGNLVAILAFARYSGTELSHGTVEVLRELMFHSESSVRAQALNVVSHLDEPALVAAFVESGWSAAALHPKEDYFEIWYGSSIVIQAAAGGLIDASTVLDRITPERFGHAASVLGERVHIGIVERLDAAITRTLEIDIPLCPPSVHQTARLKGTDGAPPRKALSRSEGDTSIEIAFKDLSETPEDFEQWQKQGWKSFGKFEDFLTKKRARLIVENIGIAAIKACVAVAPEISRRWAHQFTRLQGLELMRAQNLGLMVAERLSYADPQCASGLFQHLSGKRAFVNICFGTGTVPLETYSIWNSSDSGEMDELRENRLDGARTDHEIAMEVWAALRCGKAQFLDRYVGDRLSSDRPTTIARGLMVLGFGVEHSTVPVTLAPYVATAGLVGTAAQAAKFAYDRNSWSRHWFAAMCKATTPVEFWCFSKLFLKIVDARYDLWECEIERTGAPVKRFEASIQCDLERRVCRWRAKRQKTLFGSKVPPHVFFPENGK